MTTKIEQKTKQIPENIIKLVVKGFDSKISLTASEGKYHNT